jgi:hypothetical protein
MPYFVEQKLFAAIADHLDVETLVAWGTDERRQIALAQIARPDNSARTDKLLVRMGTNSRFAQSLQRGLVPRSWNGSRATLLERRAAQAAQWAKDLSRSETFRRWAAHAARWLRDAAEDSKKAERR